MSANTSIWRFGPFERVTLAVLLMTIGWLLIALLGTVLAEQGASEATLNAAELIGNSYPVLVATVCFGGPVVRLIRYWLPSPREVIA